MKPMADIALGGRYRLVSRIAVGGMGEVWVGHDEALARDVAVKVLRAEFAGDVGFLERFRTEARNSAGLSHPNIAALYDYGEQDGSAFLVMELVVGEPMSDLLDREPVLPPRRLLPILAQTARALHAAHLGGVVHRDVKPGNILLARSGRVKITDFGISMATNQVPMTASGMVMGTAQYLSPEQAVGGAATGASDVYSLGIVAYESLVGHRPFTGPTAVDIAVAHVNTPVPPLPDSVDPQLAALVMRMLAKDPEKRPRSAASLARTLDALAERTPPGGVPQPSGRHAGSGSAIQAAVVPGRPLEDAVSPTPTELPPVIAPGPSPAPRPDISGGAAAAAPGRWRRSRLVQPLLALALVVVFALLGAAFADRLWGPSRASGPEDAHQIVTGASGGSTPVGAMIWPDRDEGRDPPPAPQTTTARDEQW
ncbi:protein kinase [Actinotalea sp.]|uniref:protein kinase domain-containing protein n=1 Tax=Actinotalea sp. TaxID=1872145 RepID=UPI002C8806F6|nr:protein kinase [Actinotalea sp.]HQY34045.1 protein kinase [Actinotalea sp.]